MSFNEVRDLKQGLYYAEELISLAQKTNNTKYLRVGYFLKGTKKRMQGNLDEALDAYFKSAEVAGKTHNLIGEGDAYGAIGDVYSSANNHANAINYYAKAIVILKKLNEPKRLASVLSNAGDDYMKVKHFDSALLYFGRAKIIFDSINYATGKGYIRGNLGMVYAFLGKDNLAEKYINEAIPILEENEDYYPICEYLISMSDIYLKKGDEQTALNFALKSLQLAQQYGLKEQISGANLKLSELYEMMGNINQSFQYYKNYITYRDSVNNIESQQKMGDLRTDYEVSQKQVEVNMLSQQKKNQNKLLIALGVILGLTVVLLGTLYWYYKNISREKKRSESLLLNILPVETAMELKMNGKVEAVKFDQVTVLFTDFVEFSKFAEHIEPVQLVKSLDFYFKKFDEITTKYGLEKIKTIGDSYMCACGLPTLNPAHARNVINAAKEMMEVVEGNLDVEDGINHFNIRMGIHTGPVVAGIVGIKKWQYDIWGDTVNIASRMESMSKPGRINLSETTRAQIKDEFECEYRGEIEVKNRGVLKMYFLMQD
ncbi:MAG: tetratricopeptide repeat protein [Chitinophagaceae bacterium]|nr:tetratricopeptide repeat protein [Chitinophagaceae bacterium]